MTVSFASDFERDVAICRGVVSYALTICVFPSGKVTVISSRGLPMSACCLRGKGTCDLGLVLCPVFIKDFYAVLNEFRGR